MPRLHTYVPLTGTELAGLLGVAKSRISEAAHQGWHVHEYRVFEWADWHPSGHRVKRYDVPHKVVVEEMPDPDEEEELYETIQQKIEEEKYRETEAIDFDEDDGDDDDWRAPHPEEP